MPKLGLAMELVFKHISCYYPARAAPSILQLLVSADALRYSTFDLSGEQEIFTFAMRSTVSAAGPKHTVPVVNMQPDTWCRQCGMRAEVSVLLDMSRNSIRVLNNAGNCAGAVVVHTSQMP